MSNRPHLIQLDPNEDVNAVRDRLSFVRGERVLLVWPEKGTVLTRKLDLVLLQREAMRRAIRMAFVTHDPQVIQHAAELNISTFETIGDSDRKRWKRGRSKVFTHRYHKPEGEPDPDDLQDAASRVKNADQETPLRDTLTRVILAIALLLAFGGAGYVLIPSATVTIQPARSIEETTLAITAHPDLTDIDIDNTAIPMTRLRVESVQSGTVETTGSVALSDTRAIGSVVFINRTNTPITIPASTAISTSAGTPIQFRTLQEAELEAGIGLQVEVPIEALQDFAGTIGNVESGQINTVIGPLAESIDVRNVNPTNGGESRTASAVSQSDRDRLEATVRQQIQAQAFDEMQPLLTSTQFVILETIRISEERDDRKTFSANVGDTADTLSLTMRALVEATAVDEQFGRQIAFAQLSSIIPRGRVILPETVDYQRGSVSDIAPDGSVTFDMTVSAMVIEPLDDNALRNRIANQRPADALTYMMNDIDLQPNTVPSIRLSPAWMRRLPVLPLRITIETEESPQ